MFANYEKKIIEMTKSESKSAGKVGTAEYEMLKELGAERGIMVIGVPKVLYEEDRVSSSRIRKCLIEKDLEFYARVFAAEGQTSLLQKIVAPLKQQLWESFADQIGPEAEGFEFLLEYTISGMIAVYQRWFNTGRKQDIEELSRNLSILTFNGINGLSGK